jgi:hypothetical protein
MNFIALQKTVYNLIVASATFAADAASTVCQDSGDKRAFIEAALDIANGSPVGKGYTVSVWPPVRGNSDGELGGQSGVECTIVVRFEVNPALFQNAAFLAALAALTPPQDASAWLNTRLAAIVAAVLGAGPEAGGTKFQLAADAFELVNFDEGLVAYHLRFVRLAVFGS